MTTVAQPAPPAQRAAGAPAEPLAAAKPPVGPGAITAVGVILAAGVLCLGVVGIHDALVPSGLVAGAPWIGSAVGGVNGLQPAAWMIPAGAALVALGVWALVTALRPRPRTTVALTARTGVYLRPRDVARLGRSAAEDVDGVTSAKVSAARRTVTVTVRATSPGQVAEHVNAAVTAALSALASPPKIRVRVASEEGSR